MMLQHDPGDRPGENDVLENIIPRLGMCSDNFHLNITQLRWFGENLGGDGYFPQIVNGTGHPQAVEPVLLQVQLPGDGVSKIRHPPLMPRRIGISRFHRHRHGMDRGFQRLPQLVQAFLPILFHLLKFGDVTHESSEADHLTAGIFHQGKRLLAVHSDLIFTDNLIVHQSAGFAGLEYPFMSFIQFPGRFLVGILPAVHAHQFLFGVTPYPAQGSIEKSKAAGQIRLVVSVDNVIQNRPVFFLAPAQRLFVLLLPFAHFLL